MSALSDSLKELNNYKIKLQTKYACDKPELLVGSEFQKRFAKAKAKHGYTCEMKQESEVLETTQMMIRAYKSLEKELQKLNIAEVKSDVWLLEHKSIGENVIICKTEEEKLNALSNLKDEYLVFSAEELLNLLDLKSFRFKELLESKGFITQITSYVKKEEKM